MSLATPKSWVFSAVTAKHHYFSFETKQMPVSQLWAFYIRYTTYQWTETNHVDVLSGSGSWRARHSQSWWPRQSYVCTLQQWTFTTQFNHHQLQYHCSCNQASLYCMNWVELRWVERPDWHIRDQFDDDLPSQSLDWCKTPKTKHKVNQEQQKKLNNHARKLLMQRLNQAKLKRGLGTSYAMQPWNTLGAILRLLGPAWGSCLNISYYFST